MIDGIKEGKTRKFVVHWMATIIHDLCSPCIFSNCKSKKS